MKRNWSGNRQFSFSIILILTLWVCSGSQLPGQLCWAQTAPALSLELVHPQADQSKSKSEAGQPRVGDRLIFQAELPSTVPVSPGGVEDQFQLELSPGQTDLDPEAWGVEPMAKVDAQVKNKVQITAVPLKPGNLTLPRILLKDASGKTLAETQTTSMEVVSAIRPDDPKPAQLESIEPPVGLPFPFWVGVVLGLLATLILAGLIYALVRGLKRRKSEAGPSFRVKRPEHEVALEELEKLEKGDWIARGEFKPYYFRVSEIMKTYIGARFEFDALESTTFELLNTLGNSERGFQGEDTRLQELANLFEKLDRVKFSDWVPSLKPRVDTNETGLNEPQEIIQEAKQWIQATRRGIQSGSHDSSQVDQTIASAATSSVGLKNAIR